MSLLCRRVLDTVFTVHSLCAIIVILRHISSIIRQVLLIELLGFESTNLWKKLFHFTLINFVFLSVVVFLGLMHLRRPHADLLAILFDFLLAVGFEEEFQGAEVLLFGLFGF